MIGCSLVVVGRGMGEAGGDEGPYRIIQLSPFREGGDQGIGVSAEELDFVG